MQCQPITSASLTASWDIILRQHHPNTASCANPVIALPSLALHTCKIMFALLAQQQHRLIPVPLAIALPLVIVQPIPMELMSMVSYSVLLLPTALQTQFTNNKHMPTMTPSSAYLSLTVQ